MKHKKAFRGLKKTKTIHIFALVVILVMLFTTSMWLTNQRQAKDAGAACVRGKYRCTTNIPKQVQRCEWNAMWRTIDICNGTEPTEGGLIEDCDCALSGICKCYEFK